MVQIDNYVACFDSYYYDDYVKTACIVFEIGPDERIIREYCRKTVQLNAYVPGQFYKRELPGLLALYDEIVENVNIIIVDGFVHLGGGEIGLGCHLFNRLKGKTPVIGVAKTFYKGVEEYISLYRGGSGKPLFITSAGMDLIDAAGLVRNLKGAHRIPDVLKRVDQLTRAGRH